MKTQHKIFVVEDEAIVAMDIEAALKRLGYDVVGDAESGPRAIKLVRELKPDLVLMDIRLKGDMDGVTAAAKIREERNLPIIFLTAYADVDTVDRAKITEPYGYLLKPFEERELNTAIEVALHKHHSEMKQKDSADRALSESEERFRILVDGVRDYGLYMLDPDGRVVTWNTGAQRIKGYEDKEIIGAHFSHFYPVEDVKAGLPEKVLENARRSGRFETEGWRVRKDGSRFWAQVSVSALRDGSGALRGYAEVTRDATERRNANELLRAAEQRFRTMAGSAPVMIWLTDKECRATYFNTLWVTATGETVEKLSADGWLRLVHPDDHDARHKILLDAYQSRQEFVIEFRLKHRDGSYRWMLDHGVPLKSEDGEFSGFINSCVDIEDRKNVERRERDARQEAERVNRLKDEFLKTLSHELRTPLTPILGWTKLIRREHLKPADMDRGLEIIERNIHHQVRLIEDLLDVSRIISGKLVVDFQPLELGEIVESAIAAVRPALEAKGISIHIDKDDRFGPVSGDATRIQQIMWNLLSNAVKFTKRGGSVTVKMGNVGSNTKISVSDTGQGIDPNFLPHIFSRFTQADSSISRQHGGLGIGLSIVKQLVELHGGTITAESPGEGEGATFTLLLPRRFAEAEKTAAYPVGEIAPLSHNLLKGMRVLIVDDEMDSREFLEFALKTWGASARSVSSASEALAEIDREQPDIVVSDLGMPGEDGFSLLNKIKKKHPNLPVIAVTAYARSEDRKMVLEAGFKDHVSKPVAPGELAAKVAVCWKAQA